MSEKANDVSDDEKKAEGKLENGEKASKVSQPGENSVARKVPFDGSRPEKRFKKARSSSPHSKLIADEIIYANRIHVDKNEIGDISGLEVMHRLYLSNIERDKNSTNPKTQEMFLYWLTRLGNVYAEMGDYYEFIKTYRWFIKMRVEFGKSPSLESIARDADPYQEMFSNRLIQEVSKKTNIIYGNDPKLIDAFVEAINYGLDDEPCLIIGETGTGKEIVANLIHQISTRKDNNFWAVNCGGFTESLFNSEIQGIHWSAATNVGTRLGAFLKACGRDKDDKNKGYFLDWEKNQKGKMIGGKQAKKVISCKINGEIKPDPTLEDLAPIRGTLFLDEINSLPIGLQSSLLRIIQEREVMVVGEDKKRKYAAKVICAANKIIKDNTKSDSFREDLYYRIARGIIVLPALREMADSIPRIADQMINDMSKKNNYKKIKIAKKAWDKLMNYDWPGNHRQLENVLYRGLKKLMLNREDDLKYDHIDFGELANQESPPSPSFFEGKTFLQVEESYVDYLLKQTGGNKHKAGKLSGFKSKSFIDKVLKRKKKA